MEKVFINPHQLYKLRAPLFNFKLLSETLKQKKCMLHLEGEWRYATEDELIELAGISLERLLDVTKAEVSFVLSDIKQGDDILCGGFKWSKEMTQQIDPLFLFFGKDEKIDPQSGNELKFQISDNAVLRAIREGECTTILNEKDRKGNLSPFHSFLIMRNFSAETLASQTEKKKLQSLEGHDFSDNISVMKLEDRWLKTPYGSFMPTAEQLKTIASSTLLALVSGKLRDNDLKCEINHPESGKPCNAVLSLYPMTQRGNDNVSIGFVASETGKYSFDLTTIFADDNVNDFLKACGTQGFRNYLGKYQNQI